MSDGGVTDAPLLAAALHGEATYWFAAPKSGKPLPDRWASTFCFWLYPVESDLAQFADVPGFNPTDSVYELDGGGVSKVFPDATLKSNIEAKKYQKGRTTYFFVPAEEVDYVEREYKAMLKREADRQAQLPPEETPQPETRRVRARASAVPADQDEEAEEQEPESKAATAGPGAGRRARPQPEADPETAGVARDGGTEEGSEANESDAESRTSTRGRTARRTGGVAIDSHKRRAPHKGTTVSMAPIHQKAHGDHRSNEAFRWPAHYIVHRGSADYLCPARTGNSYGFRLDKVTHNGFPVFLLFGSGMNNSYDIDYTANGVPALETAVLRGEGGDRGMGNSVMMITRPPSEKHGYSRGSTESSQARACSSGGGARRVHRRRRGSDDSTSEDEASSSATDADDDDDDDASDGEEVSFAASRRRRARPRRVEEHSAAPPAKAARSEATGSRKESKKDKKPLQTASVNIWTDPDRAVPDVEQLSKQHPFAHDTTVPLRTTVFPDGTCVTYSAASAEKVQKSAGRSGKGNGNANGGSSSAAPAPTRIGGNSAEDDAMRSLLENVQLAQLQNKSASSSF